LFFFFYLFHSFLTVGDIPPELLSGESDGGIAQSGLEHKWSAPASDNDSMALLPPSQEAKPQPESKQRVIDGQVSIEQHLNIYIEDLMSIAANDRVMDDVTEMTLSDVLAGIDYVFQNRIMHKLPHLDAKCCDQLLGALLHTTGESEEGWTSRPKVTKHAEMALRILMEFAAEVQEFQDALHSRNVSELRTSLKLHRHLRSDDDNYRASVARFLVLLKGLAKFSNWKDLVRSWSHDI